MVATTTAGVTALPTRGCRSARTPNPIESVVPDQGDWQWCMMEGRGVDGRRGMDRRPRQRVPVIAQFCKALNDTSGDTIRQDLVAYLDAAPAGVIDTVDAGRKTTAS